MRGGKRPGAGRPKGSTIPEDQKRQRYQVRLPPYVIKWLQGHPESAGRLVERALIMIYGIKQPKERGKSIHPLD
jgi:hypothetical protein